MVEDGGDCTALMDAVATTAGMPAMPNAKSAKRTGRQTERVMMFIGGALRLENRTAGGVLAVAGGFRQGSLSFLGEFR